MITPSLHPRYKERGRVSVLSNSVRLLPQIQDIPTGGHYHALETEVRNQHVFRFYASHGPTLGYRSEYGGEYDNSYLDTVIHSRTLDGAWNLISHGHRFEFKLMTSINLEKPTTKERPASICRQWTTSSLYSVFSCVTIT